MAGRRRFLDDAGRGDAHHLTGSPVVGDGHVDASLNRARGIGLEILKILTSEGADVAFFSRDQGKIDAAWMIDGNHLAFSSDGTLPAGQTRVITRTAPFDHCNFTVSPGAPQELIARFTELLLGMRWDDPAVRPLLELEGLRQWKVGRTSGYAALERAVDDEGFYNAAGSITAQNYQY